MKTSWRYLVPVLALLAACGPPSRAEPGESCAITPISCKGRAVNYCKT